MLVAGWGFAPITHALLELLVTRQRVVKRRLLSLDCRGLNVACGSCTCWDVRCLLAIRAVHAFVSLQVISGVSGPAVSIWSVAKSVLLFLGVPLLAGWSKWARQQLSAGFVV